MSLDTALFLVDRGGQNFKVSGSTIGDKIKDGDAVLVQRGDTRFKSTYSNGFNTILDTDLLLVRQGDFNYHVTGANFLDLFGKGPEIEYFRHTLNSPYTLCPGYSERFNLQWKVLGDTTCVISYADGREHSTEQTGDSAFWATTIGEFKYTMKATGSNGVVETRTVTAETVCKLPTNSLTGPSSSTYGTQYTLSYRQSGHTSGDLAGSTVNASSGSKNYRKYPKQNTTYCSVLKSTNCCGTTSTTHCVKIAGYSVSPATINGVPSRPIKKDEFIVSASYNNSGKLKNISYAWELESGIDSGYANFNGNAAGRPGLFVSTDASPRIYCINNTHSQSDQPVSNPPGYLPDGVKLKLTLTNTDNNESVSTFVRFKIYRS